MSTKTKIVKSRDSATALLRKIGVAPTDYTLYIEKHKEGFEVFLEEATQAVGGAPVTQALAALPESAEMDAKREDILAKVFDKPTKSKAKPAKAKVKATLPAKQAPEKQDFYVERYMAHDYLVSVGINEADTGKHIKKTKQGYTIVATEPKPVKVKAEKPAKVKQAAMGKSKAIKEPVTDEQRIEKLTNGNSMSSFMRKCIVDGLDNKQTLAEVSKKFRWTSDQEKAKSWFPAWYRMDCRRHGLIENTLANGEVGNGKLRSKKQA